MNRMHGHDTNGPSNNPYRAQGLPFGEAVKEPGDPHIIGVRAGTPGKIGQGPRDPQHRNVTSRIEQSNKDSSLQM